MTVFLEAVHTVKPLTNTAFDAYVDWYGEVAVPAMERSGFDIVGAWKRTGGRMGQDVLLVRFENLAAFESASNALWKDAGLQKGLTSMREGLDVAEEIRLADRVPYATEERLQAALATPADGPRQYMQAVLQLTSGGEPQAYELIGKLADTLEASGAIQLVTAYQTRTGKRGELTDIWLAPGGVPPMAYEPGDPLAELVGPLREVAPEESIYYLNPLPYSPLQ